MKLEDSKFFAFERTSTKRYNVLKNVGKDSIRHNFQNFNYFSDYILRLYLPTYMLHKQVK